MTSCKAAVLWCLISPFFPGCPEAVWTATLSGGWKPVTARELALTAADVGEPDADAVILFREGDLNDTYPDGTSLKIYIRMKIFNERGRRWADVLVPYRVEQGRITDVHARTIRPDGTTIDVDSRDVFDRLLFKTSHGVWRAKVFSMPAVESGSIIEYRYRQVYPDGFRYFALDLQSDLYTKELYYRIRPRALSALDMRWITFNSNDSKRFVPQWDGGYYIRETDIPAYRKEPMMPPERTVKIWGWLYYGKDYQIEPEQYWREYSERAYARTKAETKPTRVIKRVVETITLSKQKTQDRIGRIYDYVQSEIMNIGYRNESEEQAEYKRNDSADETIRRRYGTPAEINRLFVAMLRASGLDARVAELTTRDEATFHRSFADSLQFNSEVTAVIWRDGRVEFYDPGTLYCPVGILSWEKEAVPALIHGQKKDPFVETPLSAPARNQKSHLLRIELATDGSITGHTETRLEGQWALEARAETADLSPDERCKQLAASEQLAMPAVVIEKSSASAEDDLKSPGSLTLRFALRAAQFVSRTDKRLLIRPALLTRADESLTPLPRRVNSIYFHYPWSETDRIEIRVPQGFSVEQLPDPVSLDIGAARYRSVFSKAGGCVVYERSLSVNAIYLSTEHYSAAKAFFDRIHQADRAVLSLLQN
jgi:transglutaminase-like putative cysteine protease